MEIIEVLQQTSLVTVERDRDETLYLLARIALTLVPSFAIAGCFHKVNSQGFNGRI